MWQQSRRERGHDFGIRRFRDRVPVTSDPGEPLRILLTDDDGWDAAGITATYHALTAAGHDVTMVAPAHNQSGQSAAFDFTGKLEVVHPNGDPKIYSVDSTPVGR